MNREKDQLKKLLQPVPLPGGKSIPSRILPGPMEGIMTADFCRTMMEFDLLSSWITPFIRISHSTPRAVRLDERLIYFRPLPIIAQIMGTYREHLARTTKILSGLDGVIGVELNCACSSNTVLRSGAGGAQLRNPEWIRDTLLEMRKSSPGTGIGVKLRTGFTSADELPGILEQVRKAEPDWIVIHYRTSKELFRSVPDGLQRLRTARELLPKTFLFGSGDLFTCGQAVEMISRTGVDGITPARGLMHNPWLIRDIETVCRGETPPGRNVVPFLLRLLDLSADNPVWRNGLILEITRNIWGRESEFFKSLAREHKAAAMRRILEKKQTTEDRGQRTD